MIHALNVDQHGCVVAQVEVPYLLTEVAALMEIMMTTVSLVSMSVKKDINVRSQSEGFALVVGKVRVNASVIQTLR